MKFYSNLDEKKNVQKKFKNQCLTAATRIRRLPEELLVWRLSMCNPYTYLSVPVWRTYNTCVLWSAISNMNQWNSFWAGFMMLYVYKIIEKKKKKQTQRAWIFAAAFMGFLSSTLYLSVLLYKVRRWRVLCPWVCPEVVRCDRKLAGVNQVSRRSVEERRWMLTYPNVQCQEDPGTAHDPHSLQSSRLQPPPSPRATKPPPPPIASSLSNGRLQKQSLEPIVSSTEVCSPIASLLLLARRRGLCSSSSSAPLDVSPIVSPQQWLPERDANERNEHWGLFFFSLFVLFKALLGPFLQTWLLCFLLRVFALCRHFFLCFQHAAWRSCFTRRSKVVSESSPLLKLPESLLYFSIESWWKYIEIRPQHLLHKWEIDHPPLPLSIWTPLKWDCTDPPRRNASTHLFNMDLSIFSRHNQIWSPCGNRRAQRRWSEIPIFVHTV